VSGVELSLSAGCHDGFPANDIGRGSTPGMQEIARRTIAPMPYSGDEQLLKAVMRARLGINDVEAFEKQLKSTIRANGSLGYWDEWFFWAHGAGNSVWHRILQHERRHLRCR